VRTQPDLSLPGYRALAEFRHQIRLFLHFSEEASRAHGLEPQQHQLLLALKGLPSGQEATITRIAERLQIRHHSAVELVDRLAEKGAVAREVDAADRRAVLVRLTPSGERILRKLSIAHQSELSAAGPALRDALDEVLQHARRNHEKEDPSPAGKSSKRLGQARTGT
jgi:DNA-binding MarR family transcriptional regulator